MLVVSAVVTDEDGIDDVIGGSLSDASGASYGAFETAAGEGAYEIALDWSAIDTVSPIWLAESDEREMIATFFDAGGLQTTQTLTISLTCASDIASTCEESGACVDMDTTDHCRSCGNACDDWLDMPSVADGWAWIYDADCAAEGCVYEVEIETRHPDGATCADACAPVTCIKGIDGGNDDAPCDAPLGYTWECRCGPA